MKTNTRKYGPDLNVFLGESLFEGESLAKLGDLLREEAKDWAAGLHIYREGEKPPRREITDLANDVRATALERGELYEQLVAKHGPGPSPRRTGSVELRGADKSLIIVLILDDYRFAPSAGCYRWGNSLSVQVCRRRVAGLSAADFVRRFSRRACAELSPLYAHGHVPEEWDQKNMSHEGGGTMAIGLDASRYLPGLYWLNFFGEPYCELIGRKRLLSAPAHETEDLDTGVMLLIDSDPDAWNTPNYKARESRVLDHLGDEYFFNAHEPQRRTSAPNFGLKPLPRNPRFT